MTLVARRSRRRAWPLVVAALGVTVLAVTAVVGASAWLRPSRVPGAVEDVVPGDVAARGTAGDAPADPATGPPPPVARAGGVELVAPVARPVLLGFHEAGTLEALELEVLVPLAADLTSRSVAGEVVGPRGRDVGQPTAIVLPSRGRTSPAASALDVVAAEGEPVVAPVDGTVVAVESYRLYGRHEDVRVVIRPVVDPTLEVVLLHLVDVEVRPGDEVIAGRSVLAGGARPLELGSQVDRFTRRSTAERARPHVHLEVRTARTDPGA